MTHISRHSHLWTGILPLDLIFPFNTGSACQLCILSSVVEMDQLMTTAQQNKNNTFGTIIFLVINSGIGRFKVTNSKFHTLKRNTLLVFAWRNPSSISNCVSDINYFCSKGFLEKSRKSGRVCKNLLFLSQTRN